MNEKYYNKSMKDAVASDGWLMQKSVTLSALRHYYEKGGHVIALLDAVKLCQKHSNSLEEGGGSYTDGVPDWVLEGCGKVLTDRIDAGFTTGKGQLGNEKAYFLKHRQHLMRYLAVEEVIDPELSYPKPPSLNKAYKLALDKLQGTEAGAVTWKAVRDSHSKVKVDINSPQSLNLYYPIK